MASSRSAHARGASNGAQTDLHHRLAEIIEELVEAGVPLEQARNEFERQYLIRALSSCGGGVGRSAERLGIHRNTLRNKVCSHGIKATDYYLPRV